MLIIQLKFVLFFTLVLQQKMQTRRLLFQNVFKFRPLPNQQQQQCCSTLRKVKLYWSRTGAVLAPVCIFSFGLLAAVQEVRKEKPGIKMSERVKMTSANSNVRSKENSQKKIQSISRFASFASIQVTATVQINVFSTFCGMMNDNLRHLMHKT